MTATSARPHGLLVVGATAVGKSETALALAAALGGEIVSLDSRQMVRGLDIGTAKPSAAERARVRHHLVDVADPATPLPLSRVLALVDEAMTDIRHRGRLAILVGGTGQYVRAIREGWLVPAVAPDPALRAELAAFAATHGPGALHARLSREDPLAAERIDPRNLRRVIRALEVRALANQGMSPSRARTDPPYDLLVLGLRRARPHLYARVDARIDAMLAAGLEAEVRGLVAHGHGWDLPAMASVGYQEWRGHFEGEIDRDEVVRLIRHNTRRLVRNQGAWFRASDPLIHWVNLDEPEATAQLAELVDAWGAARPPSTPSGAERGTASGYNRTDDELGVGCDGE